MKRGLILGIFLISLFLTGFASALSFSETLSFIDPTLLTLAVLFVISFGVLYFSVSKIFKGNKAISAVIAIALSFLMVYWINNLVSLATLFSGWGISDETLYTVGPILLLALIIFLFVKLKFAGVCLILGGIFILAGITGLVYSTDIAIIIGIVLAVIGLIALLKKKGKIKFSGPRQNWVSGRQANANRAAEEARIRGRIGRERQEISKERDMAARAQAMAIADADYAREEGRRKASMEALQREKEAQITQEQRQEQALQNQIGNYLDSLRQSYRKLQEDYNALLRINPKDSKVKEVYNELVAVRSEIQRVMFNNKIRYKD